MPLARYFSFVGGALLALLFILDAYLPKIPIEERAHANLPIIRIHSERKWPERVVFDTSVPAIIPAQIASTESNLPAPQTTSDVSVKTREHEAFAQMQSPDTAVETAECKKARSKAATQEQDRKEIHAATFHVGAAMAIWLVWSDSLARRLTGVDVRRWPNSGPLIKVQESSRTQTWQRAPDQTGAQFRDRPRQISNARPPVRRNRRSGS
jgi:hypothetical protein